MYSSNIISEEFADGTACKAISLHDSLSFNSSKHDHESTILIFVQKPMSEIFYYTI